MGSGAKIALVALLILMVVAVAKFVQNGSDEAAQNAAGKKDAAAGPRLSPTGAQGAPNLTKRQPLISSRVPGAPVPPSGGQPAAKTIPPAETKPAPRPEGPIAQTPGTPDGPLVNSPGTQAPTTTLPPAAPPRAAETERPAAPKADPVIAQASPNGTSGGTINRDIPPGGAPGSSTGPKPTTSLKELLPEPPAKTTSEPRTTLISFPQDYKVESGDSYWKIAEKFYGSGKGKLYKSITAANANATLLPGKTIKVPAPPAETAMTTSGVPEGSGAKAARGNPSPAPSNPDDRFEYVVQRGDSLSGIARKFSRKQREIETANPSLQYQTLRAGAKIIIPKKSV